MPDILRSDDGAIPVAELIIIAALVEIAET
jgi:hypothetical protein